LTKEENSEESYSLIFTSLKHPIRRKILRMLRDNEMTFSQILEIVSIDSGHLSYHLENLGDLITHSQDGKYELSSLGSAATRLMRGVEEHQPPTAPKTRGKVETTVKIFSIVLAATLLWVSLFSIGLTERTYGSFVRVPKTDQRIAFTLAPNQTYQYNITMVYEGLGLISTEPNGLRIVTQQSPNTFSEWKEYFLQLELKFDQTANVSMTIRDPSSTIISESALGGYGAMTIGPNVYITQPGTYQVEIRNLHTDQLDGEVAFEIMWEQFTRPLFYYGITGAVVVSLFSLVVLVTWIWAKKSDK
jgi:DNA-binding transcriptional ArsR family regulator